MPTMVDNRTLLQKLVNNESAATGMQNAAEGFEEEGDGNALPLKNETTKRKASPGHGVGGTAGGENGEGQAMLKRAATAPAVTPAVSQRTQTNPPTQAATCR
mmetsp:Transcript_4745/g.10755  ORF Transcript_4745/g.10755 Transcript_4745/m.10755 type:complete len:102 (-) Transcript_4745:2950-3255(-)